MSTKYPHKYDIVGSNAAGATLTALPTDNTKSVIVKGMANQMLAITYTPKSGQSNRYGIVTIEIHMDNDLTTIPTTGWVPYSAGVVSSNPNEVDLLPVVEGIVTGAYGTPLVLPANSGTPNSTGAVVYNASWNLSIVSGWVRISMCESGSSNFGTGSVIIQIQE